MKKIIYFIAVLLFAGSGSVFAQNTFVTGSVTDGKDPLVGASILEKGQSNSTSVDGNGNFKIVLKKTSAILVIKFVGYLEKEVAVRAGATISVILSADTKGLEEVVVVGYGQKKKITNVGSLSQISGESIRNVPTSNLQNTLSGRLPGFSSQQRSGQPGRNAANFFIRGVNSLNGANNALIIVDDIEYSYDQVSQLDANEIETVTILKDASTTAVYGIKGANGVLVITTRRGKAGKPQFNFTAQTGFDKIIQKPRFLGAYDVAVLRNEALANDGLAPDFTQADLDLFKSGSDPYGHPNTDWMETLLNDTSPQSRLGMDIQGGNDFIKYFVSLGSFSQEGALKNFSQDNDINSSYFYRRQNFRTNLDINPNKRLKLRFDLTGRLATTNEPNGVVTGQSGAAKDIFYELYRYGNINPFMPAIQNPNGTWASNRYQTGASLVERLALGGYNRYNTADLNIVLGATHQLDFLAKGLSANINVAYASSSSDLRSLSRNSGVAQLPSYIYDQTTASYSNPNNVFQLPLLGASGANNAFIRTLNVISQLNYSRSFGNHNVGGLLLYRNTSSTDRWLLPVNSNGFSARANYDFKSKYLFEFTVARYGTDKFQGSKRFGIFPSVSAGWNVAEEKFFQQALPFVDLLKFRGSYGLVGSDQGPAGGIQGQIYASGNNYNFGNTSTTAPGIIEGALINTDINWEQEEKLNLAVDVTMFKKLSMTAEYFNDYRYDQVITPTNVSLIIGQALGSYNLGISKRHGVEFQLTYKGNIGKVGFTVSPQISYVKNKVIYGGQVAAYPWLSIDGQPIGIRTGYIAEGFYSQSEIDGMNAGTNSLAKPSVPVKAGYLKYRDMQSPGEDGYGVIDSRDLSIIGKPNLPTTTGGLNLAFDYKGFHLDALFQAAMDYSIILNSDGGDPFNSNLTPIHLERWTPATAGSARYPLLSTKADSYNYSFQYTSTFWVHNMRYLRFKQLQLSYALPTKWISKLKLNSVMLTASGYNLLTWDNNDVFEQDAEASSSSAGSVASGDRGQTSYPNSSQYLFGVKIGF
ncbi:TonB-dependent receptor [Pedobacter frigidisoli]|uniref:SusC/RagA family TonB-linked outer membrane protein n=1 Tax=Pedobacter frigidisoli TaxID=2530455 RepID=UPI00292E1570|nr:TonB-dependent receptor [Pedobacter frigidisoli]